MEVTALHWVMCGAASVPVLVLAIESLLGSYGAPSSTAANHAPPVTVLMPAHDEASGIERAVGDVLAQLRTGDELIVVADNCSDDTAVLAARLGARVVVRNDCDHRGKGYALEFGSRHVASDPNVVIIIIDADCSPEPGAIHQIATTAANLNAVVQGAYLLTPGSGSSAMVRISCFAFLLKNLVRQRALSRLAGAVLLQGSGMAFPYPIFKRVDWHAGSLVEDLELGMDLLLSGNRVVFDDAALFTSKASSQKGTVGQRRRWEHGALLSMRQFAPRLICAGVLGRPRLLVLALDQLVPPTALLIAVTVSVALLALLLGGSTTPLMILMACLLLLGAGILVAWLRYGRSFVPVAMLPEAIRYIFWKVPIALQFVTRRERNWVRTGREP